MGDAEGFEPFGQPCMDVFYDPQTKEYYLCGLDKAHPDRCVAAGDPNITWPSTRPPKVRIHAVKFAEKVDSRPPLVRYIPSCTAQGAMMNYVRQHGKALEFLRQGTEEGTRRAVNTLEHAGFIEVSAVNACKEDQTLWPEVQLACGRLVERIADTHRRQTADQIYKQVVSRAFTQRAGEALRR